MNRLPALLLLPATLGVAGCASKASMDARYDASLQHWRGASRAELEAALGRAARVDALDGNTVLTWLVRLDSDNGPAPDGTPMYKTVRAGGGGVGSASTTVTTMSPGAPAPAVVPVTCSTHFTLKDGRVASWTFEGLGCGAPY